MAKGQKLLSAAILPLVLAWSANADSAANSNKPQQAVAKPASTVACDASSANQDNAFEMGMLIAENKIPEARALQAKYKICATGTKNKAGRWNHEAFYAIDGMAKKGLTDESEINGFRYNPVEVLLKDFNARRDMGQDLVTYTVSELKKTPDSRMIDYILTTRADADFFKAVKIRIPDENTSAAYNKLHEDIFLLAYTFDPKAGMLLVPQNDRDLKQAHESSMNLGELLSNGRFDEASKLLKGQITAHPNGYGRVTTDKATGTKTLSWTLTPFMAVMTSDVPEERSKAAIQWLLNQPGAVKLNDPEYGAKLVAIAQANNKPGVVKFLIAGGAPAGKLAESGPAKSDDRALAIATPQLK